MSALGQKQTFAPQQVMSALPPKADMCGATRDVRFVPIADMCGATSNAGYGPEADITEWRSCPPLTGREGSDLEAPFDVRCSVNLGVPTCCRHGERLPVGASTMTVPVMWGCSEQKYL